MTLLGYEVSVEGEDRQGRPTYVLTGSRGAKYYLARHGKQPEMMYPVRGRFLTIATLKGHSWFTDRNGRLEVWD